MLAVMVSASPRAAPPATALPRCNWVSVLVRFGMACVMGVSNRSGVGVGWWETRGAGGEGDSFNNCRDCDIDAKAISPPSGMVMPFVDGRRHNFCCRGWQLLPRSVSFDHHP